MGQIDSEQVDIINFADMHINSKSGLCTPTATLDDNDGYNAGSFQRSLWAGYLEIIQEVKRRAVGHRLVCVLNGDIIEMDAKGRGKAIISQNPADVKRIAANVLDPLLEICSSWYVIRGTGAHVGIAAWGEEMLAEDIESVPPPGITYDENGRPSGPVSFWHLRRTFGGWRYDFSHHIRGNTKNAANRLAVDTINNYARRGELPPHFVVRAHVHRIFDSGNNYKPLQAITCPCMEGPNEYAPYRIGAENEMPEFGALYFTGGRVEPIGIKVPARRWIVG